MNAEIITIGTELLLGEIVDTNATTIARLLRDIGVNIYFLTTVGDNRERIAQAIRTALGRADVVITTGGLGPTVDDMTRQAVADATGRELEFRPELFEEIRERFRQFGIRMSENNRVQAYIPKGAIPLHNRLGTAPCYIVETEAGTVISLPGVPREMKDLLVSSVIPYLRERMGGKGIIKARILRTAGISESSIDARIADLMRWKNPTVGLAAHTGQTDIRITARADTEEEADALIARAEATIRQRLGEYIFGTDGEPLEEAFINLLREKGLKLAVSYTGPQETAVTERFSQDDVVVAKVCETELRKLLARLGRPTDLAPETLDFAELSQAEAARLLEETGADVVLAYVTHSAGTGITARAGEHERTRRYAFGGAGTGAPYWAGTWAIGMAWHLVRRLNQPPAAR